MYLENKKDKEEDEFNTYADKIMILLPLDIVFDKL